MTTLPIRRIILYKHGVGYFERRGDVSGRQVRLSFPLAAMDDMLKSLVALDLGAGQVYSIDFETPEDRAAQLAKGSIHLSDEHSLTELVRDLRGRQVRCLLNEYDEVEGDMLEGLVIGIDREEQEPLKRAVVALYQPQQRRVRSVPLASIEQLDLLDATAAADLDYFLQAAQSEEDRRSATLHLSPGEHSLLVGYIAPAPAWRVSYRLLYAAGEATEHNTENASFVLLQGWGLFDNQLEEDLEDVRLTLVAGMPVSFRYRLYEPYTPQRPLIADEERTVNAPVFFEGAPPPAPAAAPQRKERARGMALAAMDMEEADTFAADEVGAGASFSADSMAETVQVAASGSERGALFAYEVGHPVSVGRGQSAMVPILSQRISCRRELLYNDEKLPKHPVASLRMQNETGLTLERGPVTVLEEGDYAGEAVVPFTHAGAELIVPFAVELGITVEKKRHSERRINSIRVRDDYLLIEEYDIQHTDYHLTSTLSKAVRVTIEHMRRGVQYELVATPEPRETGTGFLRWDVGCAPGTRTVFEVHERRLRSRHEQLEGLSGERLHHYLRNRFLDEATGGALQEILHLFNQARELQQQITRIEREREAVYRNQKQIQGNLGPLGREGEELALRRRYVAELNKLEDQLGNLAAEERQLHQQIAALEQAAKDKIRALGATNQEENVQ